MTETQTSKFSILYIGGDSHVIKNITLDTRFNLFHVENGLEGLDILQKNVVLDAILCEMWLPGSTGLEFFKLFSTTHLSKSVIIPFILVIHDFDNQIYKESFELGINDFYIKPLNLDHIYLRIEFIKKHAGSINSQKSEKPEKSSYKMDPRKRIFDILVAGFALLILSPILLLFGAAIWIESGFKGKVYYTSKRFGQYQIFDFYKLRSMYLDADKRLMELSHLNQYAKDAVEADLDTKCPRCAKLPKGQYCSHLLDYGSSKVCEFWFLEKRKAKGQVAFLKIKNDPRVTKVGKIIRNTSIDELPQLFNVLKGDMSIVGNRPLPLYEANMLTTDQYSKRFSAPAGITGLWQVELRGKKGNMSEEERKMLDNNYADNNSFWGDILLILRTIPALFQKENV
jgi:lipopolysaccharide/colanic/teichoic acid biosynthesis glycosyltransferase